MAAAWLRQSAKHFRYVAEVILLIQKTLTMKKLFYIAVALFVVVALGSMWRTRDWTSAFRDNSETLRRKIDGARMVTYTLKGCGASIAYPDFFEADTVEDDCARFTFKDDKVREVRLVVFVEPNVDNLSVKEAMIALSDTSTVWLEEGSDFFTLAGTVDERPGFSFIEKCFLVDNKWVDFAIYYETKYEWAVRRLADSVLAWHQVFN